MTDDIPPKVGTNASPLIPDGIKDEGTVPEKLYMIRADVGMKSNMFMLTADKFDNKDIEYILKDIADKRVGESYGKAYNEGYGQGYSFGRESNKFLLKDAVKYILEIHDKYEASAEYSYLEFSELWQVIKKTRAWYIKFIEDEAHTGFSETKDIGVKKR